MIEKKIEELFEANSIRGFSEYGNKLLNVMSYANFTQAINQAEKELKLEWYRELEKKLKDVSYYASYDWGVADNVWEYYNEIKNKIKELEDGHSQDR